MTAPLTHVDATITVETIPESFGQGQEPDLLALLGLEEQGWMNGLAPPPVEEDMLEEPEPVVKPQHGRGVSTGQSSSLTSLSCTPAPVTPLDNAYSPATEFEDIHGFESDSHRASLFLPPGPVPIPSVSAKDSNRKLSRYLVTVAAFPIMHLSDRESG